MGSGDGSRYDQMLNTVTGLQGDLQRALGVCQSLREENETLKVNYDTIKGELLRTRDKYSAQRKQLLEAVEAKIEGDRTTEAVVHKWRVQLEARTKELESLRSQLVPQDLDMLRMQMQEEIEGPHKRRLAAVEAEAEKHRRVQRQLQMFFNVRRDLERCRAEYEQSTIDHTREAETVAAQHKSEVAALRMRLAELEATAADAQRSSQETVLRRRLQEMSAADAHLRQELSAVRADKEKLEVERHRLVLAHQGEVAAARAAAAALDAEKAALARRCEELVETAQAARAAAHEAQTGLAAAVEEVARLRGAVAAKERAANEARADAAAAAERAAAATAAERADLSAQLDAARKRASAAERRAKEAGQAGAERAAAAAAREERARKEAASEMASLQAAMARLEEELEKAVAAARGGDAARAEAVGRLQRSADAVKSEAARLLREKQALLQRVTLSQTSLEKAKMENATVKQQLDEERRKHELTQIRLKDVQAAAAAAEAEAEHLTTAVHRGEDEMAAAAAEAERLRDAHVSALRSLRAQTAKDAAAAAARAEAAASTLRKAIKQARRRAHKYKALALDAQGKITAARRQLALQAVAAAHQNHGGSGGADIGELSRALARAHLAGGGFNLNWGLDRGYGGGGEGEGGREGGVNPSARFDDREGGRAPGSGPGGEETAQGRRERAGHSE
ncbi:hypothetical protein JKP88DRAFT_328851 [Tribonema minus]|uniref:Uncharacterized protein n=1 Tax=Tribonema minus TaxID=303371 RepID=A0A835YNG1_9STRA|nr:hypothetical protein JKP88DRAFT_328851 [Tribonema minus]